MAALAITLLAALPAGAQFSLVPAPMLDASPPASAAAIERHYRQDAARHLYRAYPLHIHRGKLPPLMYSVMVTETEIDDTGTVRGFRVLRRPAAAEVAPWVEALVRRAAPYPLPAKMQDGFVRYVEVWLIDRSGRFQLDTLTEGQN